MKRILFFIVLSIFLFGCETPASLILDDYDYFFQQFELTHPDPYTAFGGKKAFRHSVKVLRHELSRNPEIDANDLQACIARFLVPLHDGHTYCGQFSIPDDSEPKYLPLNIRAMGDGFFVWGAAEEYDGLLGASLKSVGGLTIDELCDRLSVYLTAENKYDFYRHLNGYQINSSLLGLVLSDFDSNNIEMSFTTRYDADTTLTVKLRPSKEINSMELATCSTDPRFPATNLEYKWADEDSGIMTFKCSSVISRDCLEYMKEQGMGEFESTLSWAWGDTPLEDVPSIADRFGEMLETMKSAGAEHLIIDLRGNGGGWTPIVYSVLYQLFGDDFIMAGLGANFETRISELYLQKNNVSLDEFNEQYGTSFKTGDMMHTDSSTSIDEITDELREEIIDSYMCIDKDILWAQNGAPLYRPKDIYVVTNEQTFSAAFHFAFLLWRMGATVVGVPSGQAPNTYMEITPFTLPNTGIQCSSSNSIQRLFPDDDPRAEVFWPDWMPTWEEYRTVGFDSRADLLLILEKIAEKNTENT